MKDLSEWRNEIDELDKEILRLLNRRAECVLQLAPLKREMHIDVVDPDREQNVHRNLHAQNGGPLADEVVSEIFDAVMAAMRRLQQREPAAG